MILDAQVHRMRNFIGLCCNGRVWGLNIQLVLTIDEAFIQASSKLKLMWTKLIFQSLKDKIGYPWAGFVSCQKLEASFFLHVFSSNHWEHLILTPSKGQDKNCPARKFQW